MGVDYNRRPSLAYLSYCVAGKVVWRDVSGRRTRSHGEGGGGPGAIEKEEEDTSRARSVINRKVGDGGNTDLSERRWREITFKD